MRKLITLCFLNVFIVFKGVVLMGFIDYGLNQTFQNCRSLEMNPEGLWAKGQPDNKGGMENVLGFDFNADNLDTGYGDYFILSNFQAFCEIMYI